MRIGELGERAGLSAKTIRYYEDIEILPEPGRTSSGYRDYDDVALERLRFIKSAQAVGFSLGEIREVLAFGDRGEAPCVHVTHLMQERIRSLSEHIRGLEQMRSELERLVKKAKTLPGPDSGTFCHIIELARPSRSR
jgi:DNA-binding transcriptional MerR regulator